MPFNRVLARFKFTYLLILFIISLLAIPAYAQTSEGCTAWNGFSNTLNPLQAGSPSGSGLNFTAGDAISVQLTLVTATDATVSLRQTIATILDQVNFTSGTATLSYTVTADGNLQILIVNEAASDGSIHFSSQCTSPSAEPIIIEIQCIFEDGRINNRDCDSNVVAYQSSEYITLYSVDAMSSAGDFVGQIALADVENLGVPQDENLLLLETSDPNTGASITLWRLTSGELQLNTFLDDGKPYVFTWRLDEPFIYVRLQ